MSLYEFAVAPTDAMNEYDPLPAGDRRWIDCAVFPVETSVHARLICVPETAVAVSPVGVAGTVQVDAMLL